MRSCPPSRIVGLAVGEWPQHHAPPAQGCTQRTRLLHLGFFRIGTEGYAEQNQSYGLATIRKRHVKINGDMVTFDYVAKSGKRRIQSIVDPDVYDVIKALKARTGGGPELLAYQSD